MPVLAVWAAGGLADESPREPPRGLSLAEKGYWTLLNKPLTVPITEEVYDSLWNVWPEPLRAKAEKATPRERRKMALVRYGFQELPGRDTPLQFTPADKGAMAVNCFLCHGGKVGGKVIPGLGNSHLNLATFAEDFAELLKRSGGKSPGRPEGVPVPARPPVRGVNNAFADALALLIVRDQDMTLTLQKLQFPAPPPDGMNIPLDTPAFWLAHRKKHFYYDGFIEKTHRDLMQFSFNYALSGEKVRDWEPDYKTVFAWIESVRAPKYPGETNTKLADRGREVFNTHCARCHGKYGTENSYPERLIDVEDVGTDAIRSGLSVDFKKHLGQSWVGDYGKVRLQLERPAYVAPPLDGVWATAPYLHNGSVPTLWHLLNPDKRPAVWLRTEDGYDETRVGLEVKEFDKVPDSAKTAQERRHYYQTELRGLSNEGHRYPTRGLSEEETRALLEYLKTL
jgi:mono/diheme cytochrome c family protein